MRAWSDSRWVRGAVTLAILGYLASQIDMRDAARSIVGIDPRYLMAVLGMVALDRTVMIWRWVLLLQATDTRVSVGGAARIFLVSSFVGSFLPAGIGGDAARTYALSRHTSRGSDALASVAVDRLLGIVSIALMGAFGGMLWARRVDPVLQRWLVGLALIAALGSVASLWLDVAIRWLLPARWHVSGFGPRLLRLTDAVAQYRRQPAVLGNVLALSLAVQVLRIVQAWALGLGLGIDVPFGYYLVFMPIGLLMLLLPISVSGFGLPQGVIVWLLRPQGVPDSLSFALATLIILTGLFGNLPGAWLYLRRNTV